MRIAFLLLLGIMLLIKPMLAQQLSPLSEADCAFTEANTALHFKDSTTALFLFEKAASQYDSLPNQKSNWLKAISFAAYMLEELDMYAETVALLEKSLNRYPISSINAGNVGSYAYLYAKLVRAHEQLGNFQQSFDESSQALAALKQSQFSPSLVETTIYENILGIRGRMAYRLGDYQMAMFLADSVISYYLALDEYDAAANTLLIKNSAAAELKKYSFALSEYRNALTWPLQNQALIGQLNNNIGYIHLKLGDYLEVVNYGRQALQIYDDLLSDSGNNILQRSKLETHNLLGIAYREMQAFRDAEHHLQEALSCIQIAYGTLERVESLRTYSHLGQLYLASNQSQKALEAFEQGLRYAIPHFDRLVSSQNLDTTLLHNPEPYIIHALAGKGNAYLQLYDQGLDSSFLRLAIEPYSLAFEVEKNLRQKYAYTDSKLHSGAINRPYYENAIRTTYLLHHRYGQTEYLDYSLQFMEANKAFVLWETMNQPKNNGSNVAQPQPLQEYSRTDIVNYLAQRDALVISYFVGQDNLYYLAYHDDWQEMGTMPLGRHFEEGLQSFVQFLAEGQKIEPKEKPAFYQSYAEQAHYWYHFLLQDILEAPRFAQQAPSQLIILTDGILADLPFEALMTEEPMPYDVKRGFNPQMRALPFLLKKYRSRYAYSINTLLRLADTQYDNEMDYVGFAPEYASESKRVLAGVTIPLAPLASTPQFVEKMAQLMQGKAILNANATLDSFEQYTQNTNMLQLVMHGKANENLMEHSWLAFSPDPSERNGFLLYRDIIEMKIQANLLLLTACQSGKGRILVGEGKMSLSRAFVQAGCPNVVNSLWDAEMKASTQIMGDFLQYLQQGVEVDEALRKAKLDFILSKAPNPAYWSNFKLIGGDQPIHIQAAEPDSHRSLFYYLGALGLLIGLILWRWRGAQAV